MSNTCVSKRGLEQRSGPFLQTQHSRVEGKNRIRVKQITRNLTTSRLYITITGVNSIQAPLLHNLCPKMNKS